MLPSLLTPFLVCFVLAKQNQRNFFFSQGDFLKEKKKHFNQHRNIFLISQTVFLL